MTVQRRHPEYKWKNRLSEFHDNPHDLLETLDYYEKVIEAYQKLLVAYRIGSRKAPGAALDIIRKFRATD